VSNEVEHDPAHANEPTLFAIEHAADRELLEYVARQAYHTGERLGALEQLVELARSHPLVGPLLEGAGAAPLRGK
jgi:hypothetical protein